MIDQPQRTTAAEIPTAKSELLSIARGVSVYKNTRSTSDTAYR